MHDVEHITAQILADQLRVALEEAWGAAGLLLDDIPATGDYTVQRSATQQVRTETARLMRIASGIVTDLAGKQFEEV